MAKQLQFDENARRSILKGVETLSSHIGNLAFQRQHGLDGSFVFLLVNFGDGILGHAIAGFRSCNAFRRN